MTMPLPLSVTTLRVVARLEDQDARVGAGGRRRQADVAVAAEGDGAEGAAGGRGKLLPAL